MIMLYVNINCHLVTSQTEEKNMLKKFLLISFIIIGVIAGNVMAADFNPKYDRTADCFMSLDYLDYMGPAPTVWFVDQYASNYGRNYLRQGGDIWRDRRGQNQEAAAAFPGKSAMAAWLCPEMVLAAAAPAPLDPRIFVVYFDFDKSVIRADQVKVLKEAVLYAEKFGYSQIELASYCDFRGSDDYNVGLSKRRSNSVKSWMTKNGIGGGDFAVEDNGKFKSIVKQLRNCKTCWEDRRVEITIQ